MTGVQTCALPIFAGFGLARDATGGGPSDDVRAVTALGKHLLGGEAGPRQLAAVLEARHAGAAQLRTAHVAVSMSRPGDCWDNAVMESFFATLKTELVHEARWTTRGEATAALATYIEGWYNRRRRHSTLDYLSPAEYELRLRAA